MSRRWYRADANRQLVRQRVHQVAADGSLALITTGPGDDAGGGDGGGTVQEFYDFDGSDGTISRWRNPQVLDDYWYSEHNDASVFYRIDNTGRVDGSLGDGMFRVYANRPARGDFRLSFRVRTDYIRPSGSSIVAGTKIWPKRIPHPDLVARGLHGGRVVSAGYGEDIGFYSMFVHSTGWGELAKSPQDDPGYVSLHTWNRPAPIGTWEDWEVLVTHTRSPDTVRFRAYINGAVEPFFDVTDSSNPLMGDGHPGIRGDYTDFAVDDWLIETVAVDTGNDSGGGRTVEVSTAAGLQVALDDAQPGDTITLAAGTYPGRFVASGKYGSATSRITVTGPRTAVLDGGSNSSGYGLHLDGCDYWTLRGFSVRRSQKGIMLDESNHNVLEDLEVHDMGHEGIHCRNYSSDNQIVGGVVHDIGQTRADIGEGIYFGTANSNWNSGTSRTGGDPDPSDRNVADGVEFYNVPAECVDTKEGTTGGVLRNLVMDGGGITATQSYINSYIDIKGNDYLIEGCQGSNPSGDVENFLEQHEEWAGWGEGNVFSGNVLTGNIPGYGVYIHRNSDASNPNVVYDNNSAPGAASGLSNRTVTPTP